MGRENIFKKLNKTGTTFITLGIVLGIISLFMTLIFLTDGFSAPLVIFFIFLVISVLFIIYGADYKKGENSRYLKSIRAFWSWRTRLPIQYSRTII